MDGDMQLQDLFAWLFGVYVRDAILSSINNRFSYPRRPRGLNLNEDFEYDKDRDTDDEGRSLHMMSDGQKFALFMIKHNKDMEGKRAKQNQ